MWYSLAIAPRDGAVAFMFKKVAEIDIVWKPKNAGLFTPTEERDNRLSYGLKLILTLRDFYIKILQNETSGENATAGAPAAVEPVPEQEGWSISH